MFQNQKAFNKYILSVLLTSYFHYHPIHPSKVKKKKGGGDLFARESGNCPRESGNCPRHLSNLFMVLVTAG